MNEIQELEFIIPILDTLYEEGEPCVHPITDKLVTDAEYDAMRARLFDLCPKSSIFDGTTASKVNNIVQKVKHRPPMTSIAKANGTLAERNKKLADWSKDVIKELNYKTPIEEWACQSYKLDGVALALYYEKGKLISAGLRPRDGISGEDVTENVKHIHGVVETLPIDITGTIRGEVICRKTDFLNVKQDWQNPIYELSSIPKNPRNYAAGAIRQFKNPLITKVRNLSFIAYAIISDDITEKDEVKLAKWVNKELLIPYVRTTPFNHKDSGGKHWTLQALEDNTLRLDYEVDGVIINVRNIDDREQMGHHGDININPPKGRLAWKFEEEHADVLVKEIVWETGRTGGIVPVLQFDGVQLGGTTVSQCTGHNYGYLERNKIGIGTIVRIIKSGNIIPKIVGVISNLKTPDHPVNCPSCGQKTHIEDGNEVAELMCYNINCSARIVGAITHYLNTLGVKGVAESTVQKMYDANLVKSFDDLYKVTSKELEKAGFGERNSRLAIARIHMIDQAEKLDDVELNISIKKVIDEKKKVPLWQFFASLGIESAGKTAGRNLFSHFGDFDKIKKATVTELSSVDGIGDKTAIIISSFFESNDSLIENLLKHIELELPKVGKLTGKTFVLTGSFPEGKTFYEKQIESLGGKTASSVSKKVDYVVVGVDAGSKADKADKLGIKKIDANELKRMF